MFGDQMGFPACAVADRYKIQVSEFFPRSRPAADLTL